MGRDSLRNLLSWSFLEITCLGKMSIPLGLDPS